jgi:XTP/dITP diphosphohydrolase
MISKRILETEEMKTDILVIATNNVHKAGEMRAVLAELPITVKHLGDFPAYPQPAEDGLTLEANAIIKAREAFRRTGFPSIADDTGLEVYYLLGAPGVRSARYAGENATYADNCRKLIRELTQVPERKRQARFRGVIAYAAKDCERCFEGKVEGKILLTARGADGFGYDPIFQPDGYEQTFAELPAGGKNAISHRGRALREFIQFIRS